MTSNAGSSNGLSVVGFDKTQNDIELEKAKKGLEKFLRPEFMARVDEIVLFNKLTLDDFKKITNMMLLDLKQLLFKRGINFCFDEKLVNFLVKSIENKKFGARDLHREIRKNVEDAIANLIINYNDSLNEVSLSADGEKVIVLNSV